MQKGYGLQSRHPQNRKPYPLNLLIADLRRCSFLQPFGVFSDAELLDKVTNATIHYRRKIIYCQADFCFCRSASSVNTSFKVM